MKTAFYIRTIVQLCIFCVLLSGCVILLRTPRVKTFKEKAMDKVFYITTDEERMELKNLWEDDEINTFIDSLWIKLDPEQKSAQNELRRVYEERFEFAQQHFKESVFDGWQTDRGRIYILYGPPDQIVYDNMPQDLPSNSSTYVNKRNYMFSDVMIKAMQRWMYYQPATDHKMPNVFSSNSGILEFVFVDLEGSGCYTQIYASGADELNDTRGIIR